MGYFIVTGASRGIGLETVRVLLNEGHQVLALSRSAVKLQHEQLHLLQTCGLDLSANDFSEVIKEIAEWPRVDGLIHNAGAFLNKPFADTSMEDFETIYSVNVFAVAGLTQAIDAKLDKDSHILGISSMGGVQGSSKFPGLSAYSSSKGALITLFELLAEEYKSRGVCFNSLALGAVQTEMLEAAFPGLKAPVSAEQMGAYVADFVQHGHKYYNGKVLPVSSTTP